MSEDPTTELDAPPEPPRAHATIVYLGPVARDAAFASPWAMPVAPHWDIRFDDGEEQIVDDFRVRVNARLMLLPPHDPQFRRNKERVNRDAERELIELEWDLGDDDFYGNR